MLTAFRQTHLSLDKHEQYNIVTGIPRTIKLKFISEIFNEIKKKG